MSKSVEIQERTHICTPTSKDIWRKCDENSMKLMARLLNLRNSKQLTYDRCGNVKPIGDLQVGLAKCIHIDLQVNKMIFFQRINPFNHFTGL